MDKLTRRRGVPADGQPSGDGRSSNPAADSMEAEEPASRRCMGWVDPRDAAAWMIVGVGILALIGMRWHRMRSSGVFPERPVTIICPFSPGGGTDMLLRHVAHAAEPILGRPVIVNNITGGGGAVGHAAGRLAAPDGYTVAGITFELISLPIRGLAPFTYRQFDLLLLMNMDPACVAVRADHPAATLTEWIHHSRDGDAPRIGNSGPGAVWHLAAALLAEKTGLTVAHVPFGGATPAIAALIGGHIDAVTVSPAELQSHVESGRIKILAVMSGDRVARYPRVPTCREEGVDLVFGTWRGLALPKGVGAEERSILEDAFVRALQSETVATYTEQTGMGVSVCGSAEFESMIVRQEAEVEAVMKRLGMVP